MGVFEEFLSIIQSIVVWILECTIDLVCALLLLASCAVPWRIPGACTVLTCTGDYRCDCFTNFAMAVWDMVLLCLGLLGALVPSRTWAFISGTLRLLCRSCKEDPDTCMSQFHALWGGIFLNGFLDLLPLCLCLLSWLVPTRLIASVVYTYQGCGELQLVDDSGVSLWGKSNSLREFWCFSPFIGFMEVVGLLCGLVALASAVRSCQTVKEATAAAGQMSNWGPDFSNLQLCRALVDNGVAVLVDIFFLPVFLVLAMTVWRFPPALDAVRDRVDCKARMTILRQFFLLAADVVLFLPATLVLLTWYRSQPLRMVLHIGCTPMLLDERRPLLHESSSAPPWLTAYHVTVLKACVLLLLDLMCVPLILLVGLLACYRLPAIHGGLGEGTSFHDAVVEELVEAVIDVPFLLAGLCVLCTVYRADRILALCGREAGSAPHRRSEVLMQLLRLLRDLVMLCLAVPVLVTFYRVPALLMGLKVKLSRTLTSEPEMLPLALQIISPQPTGRVGFRVRVSKSPDLAGVSSMRMTVIGDQFWQAVASAPGLGALTAQLGHSLLPLRLRDGREVSYDAVARGLVEVELAVELEQRVRHRTITRFLSSLPAETKLVLQLEACLASGREAVLLSVPCTAGACLAAVSSEDGTVTQEQILGAEARREIFSAVDEGLLRDSWWSVVMAEFLHVLEDLLHLGLLLVLLLLFPWRFFFAAREVLEPDCRRSPRHARRAEVALALWQRVCDRVATCLEPVANRHTKASFCTVGCPPRTLEHHHAGRPRRHRSGSNGVESCIAFLCCLVCPCCPNYSGVEDASDLAFDGSASQASAFRARLDDMTATLREPYDRLVALLQAWPEGPEWSGLRIALEAFLQSQTKCFFWLVLLPEWHIRAASRPTEEQHSLIAEKLRARIAEATMQQRAKGEQWRIRCDTQCKAARAQGCCGLQGRRTAYKILRQSCLQALSDVFALPAMVVLLVTFYRLPGLCRELHETSWDVERLKDEIRKQLLGLVADLFAALQLLCLTVLIAVTVVKLPDFVAGLQPVRGLRANRDWALVMLSELVVGVMELLLLLTAWKTYRLTVLAVVFAALCPAAFLATALELPCANRFRFGFSCALWAGELLAAAFLPGYPALLVSGGVLVLAFGGLCVCGSNGWLTPRGGADWWSPVVRLTLPNLLALLAVVTEGVVLGWLASCLCTQRAQGSGDNRVAALPEATVTAALCVVALSVLITALPVVADDSDQQCMVQNEVWAGAFSLVHEVLFPPVVLALAPSALASWRLSIALLYFVTIALLSSHAWDTPVSREALLDIRYVDFCSSGARLLLAAAVLAAMEGHAVPFLTLVAVGTCWSFLWLLVGGSSVAWAQVLRLGVGLGALTMATAGTPAAAAAWVVSSFLAAAVGVAAWAQRQRKLLATGVPAAMVELRHIQARLSLWGDSVRVPAAVAASPQAAASQLLELEERLPFERLSLAFLADRQAWREALLDTQDYSGVTAGLSQLQAAISVPPTWALLQRLLRGVPIAGRVPGLPRQLAAEVSSFLLDVGWARLSIPEPAFLSRVAEKAPDLGLLFDLARGEAQALALLVQH